MVLTVITAKAKAGPVMLPFACQYSGCFYDGVICEFPYVAKRGNGYVKAKYYHLPCAYVLGVMPRERR